MTFALRAEGERSLTIQESDLDRTPAVISHVKPPPVKADAELYTASSTRLPLSAFSAPTLDVEKCSRLFAGWANRAIQLLWICRCLYLEDSLEPNVGVLTRRGLELRLIVKQRLTLHDVCDSLASVQTAPLRVCPPDVDLW